MSRLLILFIFLAILGISLITPRSSGEGDELSQEARIASIARTCAACHGTDGRAVTTIPPIAGKPEVVLRAQLHAFQEDQIPGATVMPRLTKGYTQEELAAVAAYFANLDPQ